MFLSDEAHFHLRSGSVNKQNVRYLADTSPRELHQKPLHSPKVTVWMTFPQLRLLVPSFEENEDAVTVNSDRYT